MPARRVTLGLCVLATLVASGQATSQPAPAAAPHFGSVLERLQRLEEHARALELRLQSLEAGRDREARPERSAAEPLKPPTVVAGSVASFEPLGRCTPPYETDEFGVRRVRPGCADEAASLSSCAPPYTIGPDGRQRPKPGCQPVQRGACEPREYTDEHGKRRFRRDCL